MTMVESEIVLVQSGPMHCAARWDQIDDDWCWLTVNIVGTHLPQRYRISELIHFERPSELLAHGLCVACLGLGVVDSAIVGASACRQCKGSGRFGVRVEIARSVDVVEGRISIEPDTQDHITCDLCRAAVTPTTR